MASRAQRRAQRRAQGTAAPAGGAPAASGGGDQSFSRRAQGAAAAGGAAGGSAPAGDQSFSQRARSRQAQVRPAAQTQRGQTGRREAQRGSFIRESIAELRKVEWPDQRQVTTGTVVVIIACAIVGAYLWINAVVWKRVMEMIL